MVKKRLLTASLTFVFVFSLLLSGLRASPAYAADFADPAFRDLWNVTDSLVAGNVVKRSWLWGPTPGAAIYERFDEGANKVRLVQYFDKGRMEINNPNTRGSAGFVTGGLLVLDMVSGNQQVGINSFIGRIPANQIVAGDVGDPTAPTYASFRPVTSIAPNSNFSPAALGVFVGKGIRADGSTYNLSSTDAQAQIVAYSNIFGHNIPRAFWDYMNAKGKIIVGGAVQDNQPIFNWITLLGYPISEPYWATVNIGGQPATVLIQLFQRRTLTYVASLPAGFRVQQGNVGQHYYKWLYGSNFNCPSGINCSGPQIQPSVTATPQPTQPSGPNLPANVDATISPASGPAGTIFSVNVSKMQAAESLAAWVTRMSNNTVSPLPDPTQTADANGNVGGLQVNSSGFANGIYAVTFYGRSSQHSAIAYFYVGAGNPTPPPASPTGTPLPGTASASISPDSGDVNTTFTVSARGFQAGERLGVWFTDPDKLPYASQTNDFYADSNGNFSFSFKPADQLTVLKRGQWAFTMQGTTSNRTSIVYFNLSR